MPLGGHILQGFRLIIRCLIDVLYLCSGSYYWSSRVATQKTVSCVCLCYCLLNDLVGNQFDTICFLPNTSSWLGRKHNLIRTSKTTWLSAKISFSLFGKHVKFVVDDLAGIFFYKIHNFSVQSKKSFVKCQIDKFLALKTCVKFFQVCFILRWPSSYFYIHQSLIANQPFWNYHIKEIQGLTA